MTAPFNRIRTWRERIGQPAGFPLHLATDVERAMVEEIAELRATTATCSVPPSGWYCTRTPGHDGPCAAVPADTQWKELFRTVALALNCLPSSFIDGNKHVLKQAERFTAFWLASEGQVSAAAPVGLSGLSEARILEIAKDHFGWVAGLGGFDGSVLHFAAKLSNDARASEGQAQTSAAEPPDDAAVDRFAAAMKVRMAEMRKKGRKGWDDRKKCAIPYLMQLMKAVPLSQPVDIGNYAMMLFNRAIWENEGYPAAAQSADKPAGEQS